MHKIYRDHRGQLERLCRRLKVLMRVRPGTRPLHKSQRLVGRESSGEVSLFLYQVDHSCISIASFVHVT